MLLIPAVALCLSTPISAQERIVGGPYEVIGERGIILPRRDPLPPILRAGAHTVTDTFECAAGHNFSELLEERRLSGDDEKLVFCLAERAAADGFDGMRDWVNESGYPYVHYFLPPSYNGQMISVQAKNPDSWFWWVPFHPTPYATISIEWRRSGALRWVILTYSTL